MAGQSTLKIHVLDMGRQMYGDCLLIEDGKTRVLVDGGHQSDYEGQDGYDSIPVQLQSILGGKPPFALSLLVVTHCHADHIGCLPDLVANNVIAPEWALVADEHLGFGRINEADVLPLDALPPDLKSVVAALREEDRSAMDERDLADFLQDAVKLEDRYKTMLKQLERTAKVVRYGRDSHAELVRAFAPLGLSIIGPSKEHLAICAEAIRALTKDAVADLVADAAIDLPMTAEAIYRKLVRSGSAADAMDRPGKGAALNNQSIVFRITRQEGNALFAGDMQFAKAEIKGLDPEMRKLRKAVADGGPYGFAKLTHHTSYNGVDESVLTDFGDPPNLAHTGGLNDPGHPDADALALLKSRSRDIQLARTDRNGLFTFTFRDGFEVSKGRLNNFTTNAGGDISGSEATTGAAREAPATEAPAATRPPIDVLFLRIPYENGRITIGGIPITIEVPGKPASPPPSPSSFDPGETGPDKSAYRPATALAAGRKLPPLLFLTSSGQLAKNVGAQEARRALAMISDAGQSLLDVGDPQDRAAIQRRIAKGDVAGVVVLGGYNVIPSERVDVLDAALRQRVGAEASDDADGFIVWSDDCYGDIDGDGIAELPVARIPDGCSSDLLMRCLTAAPPAQAGRYGIRNMERPFADAIWGQIAGNEALLSSGPSNPTAVISADMRKSALYFMLHGDYRDATRFWGEEDGPVEALNIGRLPTAGLGTVMAGCCWGALPVSQIASRANGPLGIRTPKQSLALSFLYGGAVAFVGCTGAHYSPDVGESFFGEPMHRHFWTQIAGQKAPAAALFEARKAYLKEMPHGLSKPFHIGIERKIYKQFTCLGLGW